MGMKIFLAVYAFALGVLVRDVAQDRKDVVTAEVLNRCQSDRENAERYAKALVSAANGRGFMIGETTTVSCRARHSPRQS